MNHREMVRAVITRIFPGQDPSRCLEKELCDNLLCRKSDHCCVDQKSDKQLDYILNASTSSNVFLKACPGAGKTEVVGMKAAYEFHAWQLRGSGIAILTFTNNAADVIRERVHQYAGIRRAGHPHFIGTLDSWLHGYLAHPFGDIITGYEGRKNDKTKDRSIRVIEETASGDWLQPFTCDNYYQYLDKKERLRQMPLSANHLQYDPEHQSWRIRKPISHSDEYVEDEEYYNSTAFQKHVSEKPGLTIDALRNDVLKTKRKFFGKGFATYHDIECICYALLQRQANIANRLSRRFPFIIVDECQDLSWIELRILGLLSRAGTKLHFVGDLNQAIYEFKQVAPEKVEAFISFEKFLPKELTDNFRSCQPIVDVCGKLVTTGPVVGKEISTDRPACVCVLYKPEDLSELPHWFETYIQSRDLHIDKAAILARGRRSMVHRLQGVNSQKKDGRPFHLATALHLWSKRDAGLWEDALVECGRFIAATYFKESHSNRVRYYCPESIPSPMQWRLLLARVLNVCVSPESGLGDLNKTWEAWAKLVREKFSSILDLCLASIRMRSVQSLPPISALNGKSFQIPKNSKSGKITDSLVMGDRDPSPYRIRITTIHSVKGQTLDAVLLVSSPNKKTDGGHWTQWLENRQGEHARFAYVASSRPKKLLAWAIPLTKKRNDDTKRIADLGFTMLPDPFG